MLYTNTGNKLVGKSVPRTPYDLSDSSPRAWSAHTRTLSRPINRRFFDTALQGSFGSSVDVTAARSATAFSTHGLSAGKLKHSLESGQGATPVARTVTGLTRSTLCDKMSTAAGARSKASLRGAAVTLRGIGGAVICLDALSLRPSRSERPEATDGHRSLETGRVRRARRNLG